MKYEIEIDDEIWDKAYSEWYNEAKKIYAGSILKRLFYNIGAIILWLAIWCFSMSIVFLFLLSNK